MALGWSPLGSNSLTSRKRLPPSDFYGFDADVGGFRHKRNLGGVAGNCNQGYEAV